MTDSLKDDLSKLRFNDLTALAKRIKGDSLGFDPNRRFQRPMKENFAAWIVSEWSEDVIRAAMADTAREVPPAASTGSDAKPADGQQNGAQVAAAIAAALTGRAAPTAWYANTCYSLLAPGYGISVAGVYRAQQGHIADLPHSVGVSPLDAPPAHRAAEARHGAAWYAAISQDIWGR